MSQEQKRYRITLRAEPIPPAVGDGAAKYIEDDVRQNRPWLEKPRCTYDLKTQCLTFSAENDYDPTGRALCDDFENFISGYIWDPGDFDIKIESVKKL